MSSQSFPQLPGKGTELVGFIFVRNGEGTNQPPLLGNDKHAFTSYFKNDLGTH